MHLSMLSRGEGGGGGGWAAVGILISPVIRHSCPREWFLTLWTRPRVRIFDFPFPGVGQFDLRHQSEMKVCLYLILFNNKRILASCSRINCV